MDLIGARRTGTAATSRAGSPDLASFIGQTVGLSAPRHLQPLLDIFHRIERGEEVRAIISTAPQHGKSLTVFHALVWLLLRQPAKRHAYATYAQAFTRDQSSIAVKIAEDRGLMLDRDTLDRWRTPEGGGVLWTSRGGPFTGHPVDGVVVIDDLLKDREEANSQLIRTKAMRWLSSVVTTRLHPGASMLLVATRWHLDDPSGQLLEAGGWEHVKLPAITDADEALWPEQRPLDWLLQQKRAMLPEDWSALYMAEPVRSGAEVFGPTTYYATVPVGPYREEHGFDAAYSTKTSSDWTVTLTGRAYGNHLYITNMIRRQMRASEYIPLMAAHGVRRVHWYASTTESGTADLLRREGIRVVTMSATKDKLSRAIPVVTAWDRGEVLLPATAAWTATIESEVSQFTGHDDAHDDIVDCLAALHDALMTKAKPMTTEQRRTISPW